MSSDIHARLTELKIQIPPDSIWAYFNGGNYRVMSLELNATAYEDTHDVGIVVVYEQLSQGSFPKGQIWVRSVEDFQGETEKDGSIVRKFLRVVE
jgi:hypothetical protein